MTMRSMHQAVSARRDDIGDLMTRRPVPGPELDQIDPFLFLNHHGPQTYRPGNAGLPFGPHPHRGFETVTFIIAGSLAHHDSGGHSSVIEAGGVQWMTAGSGLIHAEISPPSFKRDGGPLEILQLWINLPARLKMTPPAYTGLAADEIPTIAIGSSDARLALVAGAFAGARGPIRSLTDVFMATVQLAAGASADLPAPRGRSVLLYVVRGAISIGARAVRQWELATLNDDGDTVAVEATADTILLFGHADPIGEPMVAHGPFVMNSREEIAEAIRDYQAGRFNGTDALAPAGA